MIDLAVVAAVVLLPGTAAALLFAAPGRISLETRIALAFGLGYALVAGLATTLALVHVLDAPVFIAAFALLTAALWGAVIRRVSLREHAGAVAVQVREAPFSVGGGLAVLVAAGITRALYPPEHSLAIRASWRYWADSLEVAAAGRIPAETQQWGIEFPTTVSKAALNSFGASVSLLLGAEPFSPMRAILTVATVGLVAALLALGRELGLGVFAPLLPALIVLVPDWLPLSHEVAGNLRNYTAESIGRMAAFTGLLAGIYALQKGGRATAAVTGLMLAAAALTHLIPTLIAGLMLVLYSVGHLLMRRLDVRTALARGGVVILVFLGAYATVIASSGGDLGFQRAGGAAESTLPAHIDPTASFGRGEFIEKEEKENGFLLTPLELVQRYGEETFGRPVRVRHTALLLAALALGTVFMVVASRSLLPLALIAWGLGGMILFVAFLFSFLFDTAVPGDWGARRLYSYAVFVPGLLVPGFLAVATRPLVARRPKALAALALLAAAFAIVAAVSRIPTDHLPRARAGLAVIRTVSQTVPCGARMLANARTAGTWEATTGRRAVTEGHAVFLRPEILERVLPVLIGANEFFANPAANRDYLAEQQIEYLVVVEPRIWVGTRGPREPEEGDADAVGALPGVEPILRNNRVAIFSVGSSQPPTEAPPERCPL